ncbi:cupin domain-containing protein [uncultured Roseobacter sp.]|uniref:cupin domain-containing protein n=1 Tax=uncultured Roseobacter sp. TaxID=114847 RepID=UPI00261FAB6D|nr:cupin domain-containing protein [uncultured Roseobacter sp.]
MAIIRNGQAKRKEGAADDPLGQYAADLLSDSGGLTQFGAFIEELMPSAASSYDHWHAAEDEMVYILEGKVTLREDGVEHILHPGDTACWKAGTPLAHCLINTSQKPVRYLVIGTRLTRDTVTYPELDRIMHYDHETETRHYTTLDGNPAEEPF